MHKKIISVVLLFISAVTFYNCGDDGKAARSMEEIRNTEGIPVKVNTVETKSFNKYYSFFSKLSGIKEATRGALIGGRIEKIRARVGDNVGKDQVIIDFDETNPGLQYDQAKSAFQNAEKTYKRMKELLATGETAQANFDGAETQYLIAKRNYEAAKLVLFIEAPFTGTIVDLKVNEGDNVKSEAPLFTIAQLNKMRAKVWTSESEVALIKKGMPAEMNYNGTVYRGGVVDISLAADPVKQAFYAEVEFDNPKRELKSGVTVDIKILTYSNPEAIVIPRNLVMKDDKGEYVFLEKGNSAEKRYIKTGYESGLDLEIQSGLTKGEKYVVQGNALLDNGTKIKVIQ